MTRCSRRHRTRSPAPPAIWWWASSSSTAGSCSPWTPSTPSTPPVHRHSPATSDPAPGPARVSTMYSLVSGPVLGFDLTRRSGGSATAEVLVRALCLQADDLPILAAQLPDED